MKVRGGSREMDMVLKEAGAAVLSLPSNEIYAAMQTGACDAGMTSSTSLISFRLEEVAKSLTTGRGESYWFMLEPLMMSKQVFDALPKASRTSIMAVGAELEKFGAEEAQADDQAVAEVYARRPAPRSVDLDDRPSTSGGRSRAKRPGRITRKDGAVGRICSSWPRRPRCLHGAKGPHQDHGRDTVGTAIEAVSVEADAAGFERLRAGQ